MGYPVRVKANDQAPEERDEARDAAIDRVLESASSVEVSGDDAISRIHAAVAIVHATTGEGSVLLVRRREHPEDPWSGHWCFPGGRRHAADADPCETALRELAEECGIDLPRTALEKALPVGTAGPRAHHVVVAPFVFRVERAIDVMPREEELAEARWVSISDFHDATRHGLRSVPGQPTDRKVPSFDLPPTPLWGFTYALLCDWLRCGPPHLGRPAR